MYELRVFAEGDTVALHTERVDRAGSVVERIPLLLSSHENCERVEVYLTGRLLFSVDCAGNRIG